MAQTTLPFSVSLLGLEDSVKREGYFHPQLGAETARAFLVNDRINQMFIAELEPSCWRMKPPGRARPIAAILTHMHNVRVKWVRLSAPHLRVPSLLNRAACTPERAAAGLAESASRCAEMLEEALGSCVEDVGHVGRVKEFRRDGWARPWPVGIEMLCYMMTHEAHHRGQVCMLARQFGFPLSDEATARMWNWESFDSNRSPAEDRNKFS